MPPTQATPSAARRATADSPIDHRFFHRSMAVLAGALAAIAIICLLFFRYRLSAPSADIWTFILAIGAAAGYCKWANLNRLLESCFLVLWSCVMSTLLRFPMYLAARFHAPLQDGLFQRLDRMTGVEVPAILRLMSLHPHLRGALAFSYDLLLPLMVLAAIIPAVAYRFRAAKELIISTSVATLLGSLIFGFLPAIGPWVVYGYEPSQVQLRCQHLLLTLRSGAVHVLDINESGIVCFPSFHVLLAILSCVALCSVKPLRIPAIVFAVLVGAATLTTGWHYIVDVIGGVLLAIPSVAVARAYTRWESATAQPIAANHPASTSP